MAVIRQLDNGNRITDWTQEINEIENQYGMFNGTDLFAGQGIATESVVFEKNFQSNTLIPQTSRRGKPPVKGRDRQSEMISLALPWFSTTDKITPGDIQGHREPGTPDQAKSLANAITRKLDDMRLNADQTREFMKIEALKGITKDGEGNTIANMFTEFGISQETVDFVLGTAATDVDQKIREVKRSLGTKAKTGTRMGAFECMVSPQFFDKLVSHSKIREAYLQYSVADRRSDVIRADLQTFTDWGVVDTFYHQGVLFYSYDAIFYADGQDNTPQYAVGDGTTDTSTEGGYTIIRGLRDLYRGYWGPQNTLTGANQVGSEMYATQFRDPKDRFHEMDLEMAPLYFMTKPQLAIKLVSNN